jgi:hypothetical protein
MSDDTLLKKLQGLKDLRQAIDLMRSQELEKAGPVKPELHSGEAIQQAKQEGKNILAGQDKDVKHIGIRTDKAPGIITHKIGHKKDMQNINNPRHYEIDVNMNLLDSNTPAYTIHKVNSNTGQAVESGPFPHKDIGSAVKSLVNHVYTGKW